VHIVRLEHADFDWRSGSGGAAEVRRLAEEAAAYDGRDALNEAAVLSLRNHGLDTGLLFIATDPQPVGFAYVHGLSGPARPELELLVAPGARGRGVGAALAAAVQETLGGIPVTAWSHGACPAAAGLAARWGYAPVRELWLMRRPADQPLPTVSRPAGHVLRAFCPGHDDAALLELNRVAFHDHPEQGALDQGGLRERMSEDWFDADGLIVAEPLAGPPGRLSGFHWTKVHHDASGGASYGEVYVVGVDPAAQGSGLGRALLLAGLEHLHSRGVPEVVLYVEAANTVAVGLYESFGFRHAPADTDVLYSSIHH